MLYEVITERDDDAVNGRVIIVVEGVDEDITAAGNAIGIEVGPQGGNAWFGEIQQLL